MATYVLLHGAGSDAWYWHLLAPELRARGHEVVAMDLPSDDDRAGLAEHAQVVIDAIGERGNLILVAQSMAGFIAPMVATRVQVDLLVMLNAMTPAPGETPGDWWANTNHDGALREQSKREGLPVVDAMTDVAGAFFNETPPGVLSEAMQHGRAVAGTPFGQPWPLAAWPDVPTRFLVARHDRFFPLPFQQRVASERLGMVPDAMEGDHCVALSRPRQLAERLEAYRTSRAEGATMSAG